MGKLEAVSGSSGFVLSVQSYTRVHRLYRAFLMTHKASRRTSKTTKSLKRRKKPPTITLQQAEYAYRRRQPEAAAMGAAADRGGAGDPAS